MYSYFYLTAAWLCQSAWLGIHIPSVSAQVLVNGQVFTNGLAIFDAPAPNSVLQTGNSFDIAVDVSGNGKLDEPSFSSLGFDLLNIFLVSSEASVNLTLVTSPGFLQQEPGSTVKHFNSPIPSCLPAGPYNITLYELSHIAETTFFSITSIPIVLQNATPTGPCANMNPLQPQPQPFSPPSKNPFLDSGPPEQPVSFPQTTSSSSGPVPPLSLLGPSSSIGQYSSGPPSTTDASAAALTYTLGPAGIKWPLTITPPGMTVPIVVEPSGYSMLGTIMVSASVANIQNGAAPQAAGGGTVGSGTIVVVVTPTVTPSPVTVVFVTVNTLTATSTGPSATSVYTTVETSYSTTTGLMAVPTDATDSNYAGFLPINAVSGGVSLALPLLWTMLLPVVHFAFC